MALTPLGAELVIWTDVDPAAEADFNAWYDEEHMGERLACPGIEEGSRWVSLGGPARRYLALYAATSLEVFESEFYCQALAHQTEWSHRNFSVMRRPLRLVGRREMISGAGRLGGFCAVVPLASAPRNAAEDWLVAGGGVVGGHILVADPALSTPVAGGSVAASDPRALVIIEGTRADAVAARAHAVAEAIPDAAEPTILQLLWGIRS